MYTINHVKKRYLPKGRNVLDDISFKINKGEIVGVLGENGSGKTTLIKSMLKLLEIDAGSILYFDDDIWKLPNSRYYKLTASVLEGNRNLYWYLTGYENIMYFCSLKKLKKAKIKEAADHYLEIFGLYKDKDKVVGEYSRGMQQKLSIIIALIGSPEILFLDEPTLGLDVQTKKNVIDVLKKLVQEKAVTIFITSHQLDVIDSLVDKLLVLKGGKIVYDGSPYAFKQKYSENKYTISILADKMEDCFSDYAYEKNGQLLNIYLKGVEVDEAFSVLTEIKEKGYEVISFKKDTSDLEEIMLQFGKREDTDCDSDIVQSRI